MKRIMFLVTCYNFVLIYILLLFFIENSHWEQNRAHTCLDLLTKMTDQDSSGSSDDDGPPLKRKQWLRTGGNIPRSTLLSWAKRDQDVAGPVPIHEEHSEDSDSEHSESSSSSDSSSSSSSSENSTRSHQAIENEEDFNFANDAEGVNLEHDAEEIDLDNNNYNGEVFNVEEQPNVEFHPEPLFNGSKVSCGHAILELMSLYTRHAITKSCLSEIVTLISRLLPLDNSFPSSYYFLEQSLQPFTPPGLSIAHISCADCGSYIGKSTKPALPCSVCPAKKTVQFHEFSLSTIIKYLFEKRNLADAIDAYGAGQGADITRSEEYMRIKQNLSGKYDLVLQWNFDGVQPHKSSTSSIWPIMFTICEVAPQLREHFTMVAGLWHSPDKPKVSSYLYPFAKSLVKLHTTGVTWTHPRTNETHVTKVAAPVVSVDAPARAMAQNLLQYNGEFSCNVCEVEGMEFRMGPKSRKRVVPFEDGPAPLRTKESMEAAATRAQIENVIVKGVKGSSVLQAIPECDTAKSVVLDYMHLVLLGVVRSFFELWLKGNTDWSIKRKLNRLTTFLKSVRATNETGRCPNDAKWKSYKASTWRAWLLFVSLPALKEVLKDKYFQHWQYLVLGISILLQEEISENELLLAEHVLSIFVRDTQEYYGYSAMTYNLHGLLHLPLLTRRWGALWATSLFKFESTNGVLTRILHGTNKVTSELSNTLRLITATKTLQFLLNYNRGREDRNHPQFKLLSEENCFGNISAAGTQAIADHFHDVHSLTFYTRAQRDKIIFTSEMYTREKATDNRHVCFKTRDLKMYGTVQCFIQSNGNQYALIRQLEVEPRRFFKINDIDLVIKHIIPVMESDIYLIRPLREIVCKVFRVGGFLCKEINKMERKL